MPIAVTCRGCSKTYQVQDALDGKKIRCPKCSEVFTVRSQTPDLVEDNEPDFMAIDDDYELPIRRRKPPKVKLEGKVPEKKKRKRVRREEPVEVPWGTIITCLVGAAVVIVAGAVFVFPILLPVVLVVFGIASILLQFVGGIGCLVRAFQEDTACGLMYLFLPFYGLYYVVSRWDDVHPFGGCLVGGAVAQVVLYGVAFSVLGD